MTLMYCAINSWACTVEWEKVLDN